MLNIRTILSILLISILLIESGTRIYFSNWYLFDNNSFTILFCENKEDLQKMCNGACFIANMNDSSNEKVVFVKDYFQYEYIFNEYFIEFSYDVILPITDKVIEYNDNFQDVIYIDKIFHPPKEYL